MRPICLVLFLIVLTAGEGCLEATDRTSLPGVLISDVRDVETGIALRIQEGDTVLATESVLYEVFPQSIEGFSSTRDEGGTFKGAQTSFSQAGRLYFRPDGNYLSISLEDYGRDQEGFINIYRTFETKTMKGDAGSFGEARRGTTWFGWYWEDVYTGVYYVEAGINFRFHLMMRTSRPNAKEVFKKALQALDWKKLNSLHVRKPEN